MERGDVAAGGEFDEPVEFGLESGVLDGDPGGELRQFALEHRLDVGVLVVGVVDEQARPGRGRDRRARSSATGSVGSIRAALVVTANSSARIAL